MMRHSLLQGYPRDIRVRPVNKLHLGVRVRLRGDVTSGLQLLLVEVLLVRSPRDTSRPLVR